MLALLSRLPLAAEVGPPVPHVFPDFFVSGVLACLGIAYLVINIWDRVRRKPSADETFATKKELDSAEKDRSAIRVELKALDERTEKKIEALDRRREQGEKDTRELLHHEVGNMKEFISDKIAENRENNTARFAELASKLDTFQISIQGLSNDVMHQIGRLEGQMELLKKKAA